MKPRCFQPGCPNPPAFEAEQRICEPMDRSFEGDRKLQGTMVCTRHASGLRRVLEEHLPESRYVRMRILGELEQRTGTSP